MKIPDLLDDLLPASRKGREDGVSGGGPDTRGYGTLEFDAYMTAWAHARCESGICKTCPIVGRCILEPIR